MTTTIDSVQNITPSVQYIATAGQTVYPYPFPIIDVSDIVVDINSAPSVAYTVQGAGNDTGGTVTLNTGSNAGDIVTIYRDVVIERSTQFQQNGPLTASMLNAEFDGVYLILQQLAANQGLSLNLPITNNPAPNTVLTPANYASKYLAFDANGNPTPAALVAGTLTRAIMGILNNPQSAGEQLAGIVPTDYGTAAPNAFRYGVDPTGTADGFATGTLQTWINASWVGLQYATPWNGAGGVNMIPELPPARVQTTGTTYVPSNVTVRGRAHPGGNTESHTRIINNSTGVVPPLAWAAATKYVQNASRVPIGAGNGYYYLATTPGVSGATQPTWPTTIGNTVTDNTVTWTCYGATTGTDNRNNPIFAFSRATALNSYRKQNMGGSVSLGTGVVGTESDALLNNTIQNLEFWGVTPGGTFSSPFGRSNVLGDYPNGAALFYDVDTNDSRVIDCVFQNMPCGIRGINVKAGYYGGDGFANQGILNLWIDGCEFDAAGAHVWFQNCTLDIVFTNCEFYGGVHKYQGCTGRVTYDKSCRFFGGAYVDATDAGNAFDLFKCCPRDVDQSTASDTISIFGAKCAVVEGVAFRGASGTNAVVLNQCTSGSVSSNVINDAGFNSAADAIKLIDSSSVGVLSNVITTSDAATYNGSGIATTQSVGTSQKNFISGNTITGAYATPISVYSTADVVGVNYIPASTKVAVHGPSAGTAFGVPYSASMTFDASAAEEFEISATNATAFTINAPTNPSVNQKITVFIQNATAGALGTLTWNAAFKLATWTQPIAGASLCIQFRYNGTNWVERFRGTAGIPN